MLSVQDHDREVAGLRYVYYVLSRRSGGISVGVNLNWDSACNWRCQYCQVPGLHRGLAPPLDAPRLEAELTQLLTWLRVPGRLERLAPEGMRRICDVALSGNGEPTSSVEFPLAVARIGAVLERFGLVGQVKLVLITNGSFADRPHVQSGLRQLAALGGEVWFKLDRAEEATLTRVNGVKLSLKRQLARLQAATQAAPTWIQTCVYAVDGAPPPEPELQSYLQLLDRLRREGPPVQGVLLYNLARPSQQPEGARLSPLSPADFSALAARVQAVGLPLSAKA